MSDFCTQCASPFRPGDQFCGKCGAPRPAGVVMNAPAQAPAPAFGTPSAAPPRKTPTLSLLLGLLLPIGIGAALFLGLGDCSGEATGSMRVAGERGNFTFRPAGCQNTQPFAGRMGANVYGEGANGGSVYVLAGLHGAEVEIEVPGSCRGPEGARECNIFPVPRDKCTIFEARVTPTSTTINDVRVVEGAARLQCTLDDGTQVNGTLTFSGCGP